MPIQISGVSLGVLTGGPSSIALEDLSDVSIVTPLTGQYLRYNSGISEWQNAYINADVYDYLDGALSGTQGVSITFTPGPNTIAVGLGAITPTSVAASGTVTGSNLSGTNTGDQTITLTGDVTGSGTGSFTTTLATVNGNVGSFGSSSAIPVITVNAKGLITAVSTASISAATATNLSGGATGSLPYQSAVDTTTFLAAGTTSQVLIGGASAPSWSSSPSGLTSVSATTFTGALTGNASTATTLATTRTFSATGDATATAQNFDGSANVVLPMVLATVNSNIGTFASVTVNGKGLVTAATALSGDITSSGAVTTLATVNSNVGQFAVATFNAKGLATAATDLSGDITSSGAVTTLATVNGSPQTDTFRRITVNGKGLTTATSAVLSSDITTALGYTPVNKAGDTMTGALVLNADPSTALGAATKQYVDNIASGLNAHAACFTSTTATLATSSGGTITYNNGSGGVGATLTTTGSFATIGAASTTDGDRILVKDEATQANNGVYVRTSSTVLTRATDFDDSPDGEVVAGDFVYIQNGTLSGTQWVVTTSTPITIGTTAIVFSQLSGAGTVTGGTGITVTGNSVALATGNTLSLYNLATNGLVARTAANTVTARSLAVSGTGLSVSNADGVSGNPTITSNATNVNTVSTIVARDGSGNFSAGTITASLTGAASLNVLKAGDTMTGTLTLTHSSPTTNPSLSATAGTIRSIDDVNANGSNFLVNTTTKSTAVYAYDVQRSSVTVGGIKVDGSALFTTVNATTLITGTGGLSLPSTTSPLLLNSSAGTAGQVLISGGASTTPSWTSAPSMTSITVNSAANISETTTAVTTNTANTIDSFATATYRSAKYFVQVTDTTNSQYQIVEISVIHDGTTVFKTEYGQVATVAALGTFDASIATGTLSLQFTATVASTKSVKVYRTALTV